MYERGGSQGRGGRRRFGGSRITSQAMVRCLVVRAAAFFFFAAVASCIVHARILEIDIDNHHDNENENGIGIGIRMVSSGEVDQTQSAPVATVVDFSLSRRLPFCKTCKKLVDDFQQELNRSDSVDIAVNVFETYVCGRIHGGDLSDKCKMLGEIYIPALIDILKQEATEDKVCDNLHICREAELFSFHLRSKRRCEFCEFIAKEALIFLETNTTIDAIKAYAHQGCAKLQEDIRDQCNSLVEVYGDDLPLLLESITPDEFCKFLKLCKHDHVKNEEALKIGAENDLSVLVGNGNRCFMCRYVVKRARERLERPGVQEKIVHLMLNACSKMQGHADQCRAFIETYVPNFFQNLDAILVPDVLCSSIKACKDPTSSVTDDVSGAMVVIGEN